MCKVAVVVFVAGIRASTGVVGSYIDVSSYIHQERIVNQPRKDFAMSHHVQIQLPGNPILTEVVTEHFMHSRRNLDKLQNAIPAVIVGLIHE